MVSSTFLKAVLTFNNFYYCISISHFMKCVKFFIIIVIMVREGKQKQLISFEWLKLHLKCSDMDCKVNLHIIIFRRSALFRHIIQLSLSASLLLTENEFALQRHVGVPQTQC